MADLHARYCTVEVRLVEVVPASLVQLPAALRHVPHDSQCDVDNHRQRRAVLVLLLCPPVSSWLQLSVAVWPLGCTIFGLAVPRAANVSLS